uniref:Uncharacterized protein n=1 Tax=Peronospora matthiolae TaxID=2874970 RepID=A0AAV1TYW6_9STRA
MASTGNNGERERQNIVRAHRFLPEGVSHGDPMLWTGAFDPYGRREGSSRATIEVMYCRVH